MAETRQEVPTSKDTIKDKDDVERHASTESGNSTEFSDPVSTAKVEALRSRMSTDMLDVRIPREYGVRHGIRWLRAFDASALVITKISKESLLSKWNAEHPDQAVRVGDLIFEINGVPLEAIEEEDPLDTVGPYLFLHVVRIVEFPANITMTRYRNWGIMVDSALVVTAVKSRSAAAAYNRKMPPELHIRPGDSITAVSKPGDNSEGDAVELMIRRPCPGELPRFDSQMQMHVSKQQNRMAGLVSTVIGSFPHVLQPKSFRGRADCAPLETTLKGLSSDGTLVVA
mmetsp:Transcript_61436/g.146480  ORF Transcript_61436/g.146480 Transcript_61436/m.146480 type:complete len:285 (+) Transcript_61436:90-944(+)|eukprot:CAMPEP_0178439392 /NCGR_PEP_ID=MMETSP0689_2-20121128/36131_1 /TAXON_ID=160604 /ORGANISM="Amphidinium massartii, Strain CS-259" /LENGTH=284 /DNA_ID=CAMNT_0020061917 /DNA_START=77 /DNA_END=931 /DNA_ORIENTATION=+